MAVEYKLTSTTALKNRVSGFAYVQPPDVNNSAGTNVRVAVAEYVTDRDGGTTTKAPSLPAAITQANLDAGVWYEFSFSYQLDANQTDAAKKDEVEANLAGEEAAQLQSLQDQLGLWGWEGTAS